MQPSEILSEMLHFFVYRYSVGIFTLRFICGLVFVYGLIIPFPEKMYTQNL